VRESFAPNPYGGVIYKADGGSAGGILGQDRFSWKPSIHMPRLASRITLEVTGVRAERIQDISLQDIMDEGTAAPGGKESALGHEWREEFERLWDSINEKRGYGWAVSPWCWCVSFKRVTP